MYFNNMKTIKNKTKTTTSIMMATILLTGMLGALGQSAYATPSPIVLISGNGSLGTDSRVQYSLQAGLRGVFESSIGSRHTRRMFLVVRVYSDFVNTLIEFG